MEGRWMDVKQASKEKPKRQGRQAAKFTPDDYLDKSDEMVAAFQYDAAIKFCDRALEIDPNHPRGLEAKALVLLEGTSDRDGAVEYLRRAVDADPDDGGSKYMYLGQLLEGHDAVQTYSQGIQVMATELEESVQHGASEEEIRELQDQISEGFCALAEVFLTELCHEDDAKDNCINFTEKALEYNPENVQALQTMATVHISLDQKDAAKQWMAQSLEKWHVPLKEDGDEDEEAEGLIGEEHSDIVPPYEFRINTAKILMEIGQIDDAIEVLLRLVREDEEVMQVWYLLGWAYHLAKSDQAVEALQRAQSLFTAMECEQEDVLAHIVELLAEEDAQMAD